MRFGDLTAAARDAISARRVFAEPVERDGVTVIGVAAVGGGGGGGQGNDGEGQEGEGGGFGLMGRPVGAYVVKEGTVRWMPAIDVTRLVTALAMVVIVYLLTRSRISRARLKAQPALSD